MSAKQKARRLERKVEELETKLLQSIVMGAGIAEELADLTDTPALVIIGEYATMARELVPDAE